MKKTLLTSVIVALLALCATHVKAQENKFSLGGGAAYATGIKNVGFFAKGMYHFTPRWEAAASFTYFLPKEQENITTNFSALDANVHYVFYNDEYKLASYLLSGIDVLFGSTDVEIMGKNFSDSGTVLGFNMGAGLRYQLSERLALNPELKYVVSTEDNNYLSLSIGLLFSF
ncbi:MAG: porin family protein [Bacteroidia bacterium]|nr:porin family protein [Bacteroidia bacterium]